MNLTSKYRDMLSSIDQLINLKDIKFEYSQRKAVVSALLDIANEHGKGINTLFENNLSASGFALLRSQLETLVRACWLHNCADESTVVDFATKDILRANDKGKLEFGPMLKDVESKLEWGNTLSEIKQRSWKTLNSYTHGGLFQVARRFDGFSIGQHHDQEIVDECIRFSAMLTFLGLCQIVQVAETNSLDTEIESLFESIKSWVF